MKYWEVWTEGYAVTGDISGATFHGQWPGETFQEACEAWNVAQKSKYTNGGIDDYNPKRNTVWGCRLFDNEADARKAFG